MLIDKKTLDFIKNNLFICPKEIQPAIEQLIEDHKRQESAIERLKYENQVLEKGIEHEGKIVEEVKKTAGQINLFDDIVNLLRRR